MANTTSRFRLVLLILILIFIIITRYQSILSFFGFEFDPQAKNIDKFKQTLSYIDRYYVDKADWDELIEGSINGMLKKLDPHSVYFTPSEVEQNEEEFLGKYQGIGIQFDVLEGYITVISVIPGSPSEKVGLLAGDKIIKIDGKSARDISNAEVPKRLKGPKGSQVTVSIRREGSPEPFDVTITRDEIPIFTIHTYFMADAKTGYIWVNRFASTTEDEFERALIELEKDGMQRLLLDLRFNGGGFLEQAVKMVGKFIPGHKKVVYTRGRFADSNHEYYTDDFGKSIDREFPLIVLINGASASASEIVAGAIQDYDRGLIVGETSFGKGLVQSEFPLNDDSRLRLTISKYYTPSGRLIQRPYKGVDPEEYFNHSDSSARGEVQDTSSHPAYQTEHGRTVFGGGGIHPDTVIVYNANPVSIDLMNQILSKRIFFETATAYLQTHKMDKNNFAGFLSGFDSNTKLIHLFKQIMRKKEIDFTEGQINTDKFFIANRIKAEIARSVWGASYYYQVILQYDNQFREALKLFPEAQGLNRLKPAA